MVVLHEVVLQVCFILTDKLTLKAAKGQVTPQVFVHLLLCDERHFAGLHSAGSKTETVCGCQVGLIPLSVCAAELAALLTAEEWAFGVWSFMRDSKMPFEETWIRKSFTALRTLEDS